MSGRRAAAASLVGAVLACNPPPPAPAPASAPEASVVPASSTASSTAAATADAPDAGPPARWPALVRLEQWDAAWSALTGLPEGERGRPEVRYARARVALLRGDGATALPLLDGLEVSLPLLADDVARRRAEARLVAGPYAEAAAWFAARPAPAAQLDAARAYEKAKDAAHARRRGPRDREREADAQPGGRGARAARAHGRARGRSRAAGRALARDARRGSGGGLRRPRAARPRRRGAPAHRPGADAARQDALGRRPHGRRAARDRRVGRGARRAAAISNADRGRARGLALYHARGRGTEAARALADAAGTGGPHAAEDAFHAARALSRADHDDEAIRGYEDVGRRYAGSPWAQHAAFYAPYLRMLHGDWKECARGFDAYLHAHAHGEDAVDARRDGALCTLLDGRTKEARAAFERLVDDDPDALLSARMADMAALAAQRDGDLTHAVARWTEVAHSRPLSWPALVARARLAGAKAPVPPAIEPAAASAEPAAPLDVALPAPADKHHARGFDAEAEAAVRDREAALTGGAGARGLEALCTAYGQLGRARRRFQIAQSLPSTLLATAPGPRNRWAWECAFPSPYDGDVRAAETSEHLPAGILWAVMRQESAFDPDAVSPARAVGLMQLLPETARPIAEQLGLPHLDARLTSAALRDPRGARALHDLLDKLHGAVPLAVAAYNGGAESVERWLSRAPGMQVDAFVERIPFKETRDYVGRVMGNLARYGFLAHGEAGVPAIDLTLPR